MLKKIIVLSLLAVSSIMFLPSQGRAASAPTVAENLASPVPAAAFQRRNRRSRRWENRRWRNNRSRHMNRRDDRRHNRRGDDRRNNRRRGRGRN